MIDSIKFDEKGLVTAVVQDANTKEVLTVAYMNKESLEKRLNREKHGSSHVHVKSSGTKGQRVVIRKSCIYQGGL